LFWCSEHVFEAVVGVDEAISGYAGGTTKILLEQVGSNNTGHAEAIYTMTQKLFLSRN
jgi:peptide-methionine (S)-S-oxide reductase